MSTKISWCDETINPVIGCSKISVGCQNCYAENMARRLANMGLEQYKRVTMGAKRLPGHTTPFSGWNGSAAFVPSELQKPFKWKKPRSIFISSMGDLFHESVWRCWIDDVMRTIANNSEHTFILLTKRPERMKQYFDLCDRELVEQLTAYYQLSHGTDPHNLAANWPLPNLVLGVSVEDQQTSDNRIRILLQIPAAKRFVSIEPMLDEVDLYRGGWSFLIALVPPPGNKTGWKRGLDGVIVGGESGNKARILNPQWVRLLRNQCADSCVPFMFKQWGKNVLQENGRPWEYRSEDGLPMLDGKTHSELPWSLT